MKEKLPEIPKDELQESDLPQKRRHIFVYIVVALAVVAGLVVALQIPSLGKDNSNPSPLVVENEEQAKVMPTPVPFYEMTIPYLRERVYASSLSNIDEISQNANYTSYLTSYDSDGLRINAQLTVPGIEKPQNGFPAIIFIHGYIPPANYQTLVNYASYVDYLARNGFVVLKIDLRGHGASEGEASGAYYSSDYIIDTLNARAALQNYEMVNPNAIGIWGHSMAGNVTLRAMASMPDVPAAVIWAGAVYTYEDWEEFGIQDGSYRPPSNQSERQRQRDLLFETHGRFDSASPFWAMVTPTNYLQDIKGAIQLNHAVNDEVVDIGYSRNLSELLDEKGVEHELKEYSSGGHNLSGVAFNEAMGNTVEFFRTHLR